MRAVSLPAAYIGRKFRVLFSQWKTRCFVLTLAEDFVEAEEQDPKLSERGEDDMEGGDDDEEEEEEGEDVEEDDDDEDEEEGQNSIGVFLVLYISRV